MRIIYLGMGWLVSLSCLSQPYIQGSIQQGAEGNKVDIQFLPNYNSRATEYISYVSISIAIPIVSSGGIMPTITGVGNLAGQSFVEGTPFSYTTATEKVYSWICINNTGLSMSWTSGNAFTGATITFTGGLGSSKIRLVDFTNDGGGINGNTFFSVVTNVSPFDVTNFSDFFYTIPDPNGNTEGSYPNGDKYVETHSLISLGSCNPSPNAGVVSGTSPVCIATTANFTSNGDAGGSWSSTNKLVATVNALTGTVTTLTSGTTDIIYTVSGCSGTTSSYKTLTVSPDANSGTVSGTSLLCIGETAIYASNGDGGGNWTSTKPVVATVNSITGVVNALAAGTTDIIYTVNSGCGSPVSSIATLTVNANVSAGVVNGPSQLCIRDTATYTCTGTSGGLWSSSNNGVATVNASTGLVTAVGAGTTDITYTVGSGCGNPVSSFQILTVNTNANAGTVSGPSPLSVNSTTSYTSNGDAGGTWSSTNTSVATVDATTGVVTAISEGTSNITYTVNSGCNSPVSSFKTVSVGTVNAGTVSGNSPLCIGSTATYTSDGDSGGTWGSTNSGVAIVNAATGFVTAVSAGTTDISYTVSGISSFKTLIVNSNVFAGTVSGTTAICIGTSTIYTSNGTTGGTWSSSNTSVAVVNSSTGLITAASAGTSNIFYTINNGCGSPVTSEKMVIVDPDANPGIVTGPSLLAIGSTATYASNGDAGGTWSSTNVSVATINASTGLVTALNTGTTTIAYTLSTGCGAPVSALKMITVTAIPHIQGSIQQGLTPNTTNIIFLPNYDSRPGEYLAYTSISIAVPISAGTVAPILTGVGNLSDVPFVEATPFSYTSGTEKIYSWIANNLTVLSMSWSNGVPFIGATIAFTGGTGSSKIRLVDFTNAGGGDNGNTFFSVVTNVSPFDVTNFSDFFYPITGANGSIEGSYGNGDKYVETSVPISLFPCNPAPNAGSVSGTSQLYIGSTATYTSNGDGGGSWSSSDPSVATVNSTTGIVTAASTGTTDIVYTVTGCGSPASSSKTLSVTTCPSITTPVVTGIMETGATINWTMVGAATLYQYAVTESATAPTSGTATFFTTAPVTGLVAGTLYYVYVRTVCSPGIFSPWSVTSFTTLCPSPAFINVNIIGTNADISWRSQSGISGFEYRVTTDSITPVSGIFTTSPNCLAKGLSSFTTYYVYIRTNCGPGAFSPWIRKSFTTSCFKPNLFVIPNTAPSSNIDIGWEKVNATASYEYSLLNNAAPPAGSLNFTNDTNLHFDNLRTGTQYYLHVRTHCGHNSISEWSSLEFHTSGMGVYPNPIQDFATIIVYGLGNTNEIINIYDASGRLMNRVSLTNYSVTIDFRKYAAGVYFIRYGNDKKYTTRIIKQ